MGFHKRATSIWRGNIAICTVVPPGTGSPSQAQWSRGRERGEGGDNGGRQGVGDAGFDRSTRQDGCLWGGRRADAAGWKALLGLQADSAGSLSAGRPDWRLDSKLQSLESGSSDIKLPAELQPIWLRQIFVIKICFYITCCDKFHIIWVKFSLTLLSVMQNWSFLLSSRCMQLCVEKI